MKYKSLLVCFYMLTSFVFITNAQIKTPIQNDQQVQLHLNTDTLNIKSITNQQSQPWYVGNSTPWLVALIISVLTFVINIYIARLGQRTAIRNIDLQIKSSTETSKASIENSMNIALRQIENSKDLAITQFKSTLNSKNRQDWLNELRHSISELMVQASLMNVHISRNAGDKDKFLPNYEKMSYNQQKILLLLNPLKLEQNPIIELVNKLVQMSMQPYGTYDDSEYADLQDKIIAESRKLFIIHWGKIKAL